MNFCIKFVEEPLKAEITESGEFITMTGPAWTVRWAAPELLDGALPGLGSDVWAFGWISWEVVTGKSLSKCKISNLLGGAHSEI
ncbi:hypothetical protein M407DRAFT_31736 [Tulasnella calospora MUT 4182]|uniref:Serine-threonine/tyrosine-protein kinase catalytic domain-containing protein n=1 Tax=Tulasnella calospora MUT 4182 TaxID=1051891 RepID=A0A0C3Q565_9AGAM|nr:hypothetical protein M407DRAFT_31736 [Tulasnella calospora MUT 4182]